MINVNNFLNEYVSKKQKIIEDKYQKEIEKVKKQDAIVIALDGFKEELLNRINEILNMGKENETDERYFKENDIKIWINAPVIEYNKFYTKETYDEIEKIEEEKRKEEKELKEKIEEIRMLCSLTTDEEKIQEILTAHDIINKNKIIY
jgi:negative regulator of sigma E activity